MRNKIRESNERWALIIRAVVLVCILALTATIVYEVTMMMSLVLNAQEKSECLRWKQEAPIYRDYYITTWQEQQCDHYGVKIDAPVLTQEGGRIY